MSEHNTSFNDDLFHYQSLWDAACKKMESPVADPQQSPKATHISATELIQERQRASDRTLDWRDMLLIAEDLDRVFHPERFEASKAELADVATKMARSNNPVHPYSMDKDQQVKVSDNFTGGSVLKELGDLKVKIEVLERQLHSASVAGKESAEEKLDKEVASLRSKIEELSEKLSPHPMLNAE